MPDQAAILAVPSQTSLTFPVVCHDLPRILVTGNSPGKVERIASKPGDWIFGLQLPSELTKSSELSTAADALS